MLENRGGDTGFGNPREKKIGEGAWTNGISWEFFVAEKMPPVELCTAVCCVLTYQGQLVVVENKRGWELPAGNIELEEVPEVAMVREVQEETGAEITDERLHFFGYKKLTATEPSLRKDGSGQYYPFPHSYVVFYFGEAMNLREKTGNDVKGIRLVSLFEAQAILGESGQYPMVLDHLRSLDLINLR